jgi:hypothetical protein
MRSRRSSGRWSGWTKEGGGKVQRRKKEREVLMVVNNHGEPPAITRHLVDRCIPTMSSLRGALAGVEIASPRQQAFHLLHCRALEQLADLVMGSVIFECCGL